jgi:hypothetical protein
MQFPELERITLNPMIMGTALSQTGRFSILDL